MRCPVVAAWLKSTIVNAMCGCGQQRASRWACSSACKLSSIIQPRTPLHNWETKLFCISAVQPWLPQVWKFCVLSMIIECVIQYRKMMCLDNPYIVLWYHLIWIYSMNYFIFSYLPLCFVSLLRCCCCVSSRLITWIYLTEESYLSNSPGMISKF